jgi:hypothetical protein
MSVITLKSPLSICWSEQYVRLDLPDTEPGKPVQLTVGGQAIPYQYTGRRSAAGAEFLVRLGFEKDESKELEFRNQESGGRSQESGCERRELALDAGARVGVAGRELAIPAPTHGAPSAPVTGPFAGFAGWPMGSVIRCDGAFEGASLVRRNDGPLFTDYELTYRFAAACRYTLTFRCYKADPYVEVCEAFSLRMNAELVWTLNPERQFTHIISRDSFEGESQPTVEPLGEEHPRDVLCRLQMPVLSEYFIPNNRGWFSFFDERDEGRGMVGILGLYGAQWEEPVANMPEILDRGGTVEWHASLASGKRYWLLYAGPVEREYRCQVSGVRSQGVGIRKQGQEEELTPDTRHLMPDSRFVFHRLHAEFNALRLDEHLDLAGNAAYDASCAAAPGVFGPADYHAAARQRLQQYPCLQTVLTAPDAWLQQNGSLHLASFRYLLEPTPAHAEAVLGHLTARFEKWVRQFQGYRTGENDYMKNVIGFSRYLRGMLLGYEMLRRDEMLTAEQARKLNAYFAFAARRILDEGRWPHSRTWKHPDHPESSRDVYAYGGEHKPDRLVWTNCLPNFQSDPMCALAHLSAIFKDHPDARFWLRFALDDIDRQLDAYCGKSGAWEESINYALYTFSYFIIAFKAVKERWGIDYFHDERVRRYAAWLCRFFGPYDKRFDAYTWPAIGNAVLPQNQAEYLLCYANELEEHDPLRADCLAIWQRCADRAKPSEHYPVVMAAMAPEVPGVRRQVSGNSHSVLKPETRNLKPLSSEVMDEVGVAMRDRHGEAQESYLFQKIGFAKDHYEADETAFNWYAKGTPLCMDYGTYTGDVGVGGAHNVVEIPDEDNLRRGYLANHLFTPALDYTHCEVPVTLKLLWGKVRTFAEVENKDGKIDRTKTPYFYIGDRNPVGPKTWKVRLMMFAKPDYLVIFDRVYGQVPHRYNLHVTGTDIQVSGVRVQGAGNGADGSTFAGEGALIAATGRFDLDLLACVQHPAAFDIETGELVPHVHPGCGGEAARARHAQHYFRLYNRTDGLYRTVLFAQERGRDVRIEPLAAGGFRVTTPEYTDEVYLHNEVIVSAGFTGRAGWIRRWSDGRVLACVPDGDRIEGYGIRIEGRGPWTYGVDSPGAIALRGGPPRQVSARIL